MFSLVRDVQGYPGKNVHSVSVFKTYLHHSLRVEAERDAVFKKYEYDVYIIMFEVLISETTVQISERVVISMHSFESIGGWFLAYYFNPYRVFTHQKKSIQNIIYIHTPHLKCTVHILFCIHTYNLYIRATNIIVIHHHTCPPCSNSEYSTQYSALVFFEVILCINVYKCINV